ncbi:MAG: hypothetical protein PHG58_06095 [Clostridia bacterium]|jgi:hypothetical protein|nr:hypothetical protein [Clostridia bacterium]
MENIIERGSISNQAVLKRIVCILLCIITISILFPGTAIADIGPKPSVIIDFEGLEGETYYATLLSSVKSTGPYSALNDSNKKYAHYEEGDENYEIFLKFADYTDGDGYHFLQYFQDCSQTHQFSWTYYPPSLYKILLYFPDTDNFIVSDSTYERYAFDSYYSAVVSNSSLTAEKSYDATNEILSLTARIILTIVIELAIAFLFGFREKRQFGFIALVNIITQVSLNIALNIINYRSGEMAFIIFFVLLEILIVIVESVIYTGYLHRFSQNKIPKWKPGVYALVANFASFALGLVLAIWIPGIF